MAVATGVVGEAGAGRRPAARDDFLGGTAVGGAGAGAAMLAFLLAAAAAAELPALRPLELVAAMFAGADGEPGAAALALAALVWLVTSVAVALPFTATVGRDFPTGSAMLLGVGYAGVVLAFAASLVLPVVNPEMRERMPAMGGAWVLGYALYGAGLGLVPWLRRRLAGR